MRFSSLSLADFKRTPTYLCLRMIYKLYSELVWVVSDYISWSSE